MIFSIVWQLLLPLLIFVFAYWKILGVIRRRTKIGTAGRQGNAMAPEEAGICKRKTTETGIASTTDENQRDKGTTKKPVAVGSRANHQGGLSHNVTAAPKVLSRAQINVVTTMVFITVCFALCWIPLYVTITLARFTVRRLPQPHLLRTVFMEPDALPKTWVSKQLISRLQVGE